MKLILTVTQRKVVSICIVASALYLISWHSVGGILIIGKWQLCQLCDPPFNPAEGGVAGGRGLILLWPTSSPAFA